MTAARARDPRRGGDPAATAAYKALLRAALERRPSGMRARIASAIGKHKSFVSQLTNPAYATPIPARHLPAIFEICHFSEGERRAFLAAYARAHPGQGRAAPPRRAARGRRTVLSLEVPALDDPRKQRALERLLRDLAEGLAALLD